MTRTFLLALLLFPVLLKAQNNRLAALEDSIQHVGPLLFKGTDPQKQAAGKKLDAFLTEALKMDESWDYNFDSLKFMAHLKPKDDKFRLYNWHIPNDDGTFSYYGYIQLRDEKTKKTELIALEDHSDDIRSPEMTNLQPEKWYGALYYSVLENKSKDKDKTYYTLLGWDGNNKMSWKKVIDVLSFDNAGNATFGAPIFDFGRRTKNRVIFEFKAEMVMVLRYDDKLNQIVFDKLVPEVEGMTNPPPYMMVNSFEYLGFKFKKGKWQLQDADPTNKKNRADKIYGDPTDKGPAAAHPETPEKHGFFYRLFHGKKKTVAPPLGVPSH